jgi:hypothetical protein
MFSVRMLEFKCIRIANVANFTQTHCTEVGLAATRKGRSKTRHFVSMTSAITARPT